MHVRDRAGRIGLDVAAVSQMLGHLQQVRSLHLGFERRALTLLGGHPVPGAGDLE